MIKYCTGEDSAVGVRMIEYSAVGYGVMKCSTVEYA